MPKRTIAGTGKKFPFNMRTTAKLRARIEQAAGKSGRSLVQEVEHRVEMSFHREKYDFLHGVIEVHERRMNDLDALQHRIEGLLLKHEAMWVEVSDDVVRIRRGINRLVNVLLDGPMQMGVEQRAALRDMLTGEAHHYG